MPPQSCGPGLHPPKLSQAPSQQLRGGRDGGLDFKTGPEAEPGPAGTGKLEGLRAGSALEGRPSGFGAAAGLRLTLSGADCRSSEQDMLGERGRDILLGGLFWLTFLSLLGRIDREF